MSRKQKIQIALSLAVLFLFLPSSVLAQYSSPNYRVDEAMFGTGGEIDLSSPNYQGIGSVGSLGVSFGSSSNYAAEAGFLTSNEPFLEMVVSDATVDLGLLSADSTSAAAAQAGDCNCSFWVRTYLSDSYVVITMSPPPTSESGAVLTAKSVLGPPSSDLGVEEFGINLVSNTDPAVGADPFNDPDNSFADGEAATGYNSQNNFKYALGDIIARSPATAGNPATGKTNFTISYIAKQNPITPAGLYEMEHDIVAVATY